MKTVLLASGGSGGHLAPAIALAQCLRAQGLSPIVSTTRKGVDRRLQVRYPDLDFVVMSPARKGEGLRAKAAFAVEMAVAVWRSATFMNRTGTDLVFATGGFGCAPVATAACLLGIPLQIHESNSVPGKLSSLFRSVSQVTWVTRLLNESCGWRNSRRVKETGVPLRAEFQSRAMKEAKVDLGLDPNRPVVTVFGGSQGARSLNNWAITGTSSLRGSGVQIVCVSGPSGLHELVPDGIKVIDFCDDMPGLYSASDLIIARSGSGTLSELAAFGVPSVLVPYPYAAADHQLENARRFACAGCGVLLEENELDRAEELISHFLADPDWMQACRVNLGRWDAGNSVDRLVRELAMPDHGCGDLLESERRLPAG